MNKIIIVHLTPLLQRLKDAYLIEAYFEAGYNVEYWDITNIRRPDVSFPDELSCNYIYKLLSLEDLVRKIAETDVKSAIFLIPFPNHRKNEPILRILSGHGCCLIRLNIYQRYHRIEINRYALRLLFSWNALKMIYKDFSAIIYDRITGIHNTKGFDYYFSTFSPCTHFINSPNYDMFMAIKDNPYRLISIKYLLFIDDSYPTHPEMIDKKSKSIPRIAVDYHKSMRRFFNWLETHFQMPVVIAAHPSSTYKGNEFGDRRIIKNQTAFLVKDAEKVLFHVSTANCLALLFDKPVMIIKTNQMDADAIRSHKMNTLAQYYGKPVYNIDKMPFDLIEFSKVKKPVRKKYIYSQLTSKKTDNKLNKEIIINEFKKIFESRNSS